MEAQIFVLARLTVSVSEAWMEIKPRNPAKLHVGFWTTEITRILPYITFKIRYYVKKSPSFFGDTIQDYYFQNWTRNYSANIDFKLVCQSIRRYQI